MKLSVIVLPFMALQCKPADECRYSDYMHSQSLVWEELPMQWNEAAFTGNGVVGQMMYVDTTDNSVTLWLGRADVTDHRLAPDRKSSLGVKGANKFTDFTRLDVGKFKLFFAERILSGRVVQDICTAEILMELTTEKGKTSIEVFTPYDTDLHVMEVVSDSPYTCYLVPGCVRPSRMIVKPETIEEFAYEGNPYPVFENSESSGYYVQSLEAGGDYAVCWEKSGDIVMISTKNGVPLDGVAIEDARSEVSEAFKTGVDELKRMNEEWWRAYYTKGLIEIPDRQIENFYNIQMYKLAASSAKNGPAMDLMGPFYKTTQWPAIWWNLNIQLTYMSTLASNRLDQCENYARLMEELFEDIVSCTAVQKSGDYVWSLFIYYKYLMYKGYPADYRYDRILPGAERLLEMYSRNFREEDGVINLIDMESPEYEGFNVYKNSNYNLSCLRWLLETLISLDSQTGRNNPRLPYWKDVLARLHPYETDENGMMIATDVPLAKSHRHYSHLLSYYPLAIQDMSDESVRNLLIRSVDHWVGIDKGKALAGYSYTGAASLFAHYGDGDKAHAFISHFLNKDIGISILLPNTFYVEGKGRNPVIETPLSAVSSIAEMLLQSWGGVIRIFPAVPSDWKDCAFETLRAEGGFDVSARMSGGKLSWVRIYNDAGNVCRIYLPDWAQVVAANDTEGVIESLGDGYYEIKIPQGEEIVISDITEVEIIPVHQGRDHAAANYFGVKKGKSLKTLMDWPYPEEFDYLFPKNPYL